jgi:hypothetical protein
MKVTCKLIPSLISLGLALLIAYGFYAANIHEWQRWLMFAVCTAEFSVLLGGGFGLKYAERGTINITVLSVVFIIIAVIVQLIANLLPFRPAPYIIVNGLVVLIYIGIAYAIVKTLQE